MKKTLFVLVIAVVLVLAFATTAMASGRIPNRSSAYLTTIATPGQTSFANDVNYYNQQRALAAGGIKAAYITWGEAKATMESTAGLVSAGATDTLHGNYATTTVKCQVCHSVHKADKDGSFLLAGPSNSCVVCHGSTSTMGIVKVASGSSMDNRHGSSCGTLCHTESPHGAEVSEYAAGASALFSDWSDFLTGAAIKSASATLDESDTAVTAIKYNADLEGYIFDSVEVKVFQPGLDTTSADLLAINTANSARGRAIQTGYLCSTEGCHMNGAFNGVTDDAYVGNWVPKMGGVAVLTYSLTFGAGTYNSEDLRTSAIKGHELYNSFATPVADDPATPLVNETVVQTAFATSGTCKACHDATDVRSGVKAFPHSNAVWVANSTETAQHTNQVLGGVVESLGTYGYTKLYNDSAWFLLASSATSTTVNTNTRRTDGNAPDAIGWGPSSIQATYQPRTVAMDGACLKCHRTGDGATLEGVGIDY